MVGAHFLWCRLSSILSGHLATPRRQNSGRHKKAYRVFPLRIPQNSKTFPFLCDFLPARISLCIPHTRYLQSPLHRTISNINNSHHILVALNNPSSSTHLSSPLIPSPRSAHYRPPQTQPSPYRFRSCFAHFSITLALAHTGPAVRAALQQRLPIISSAAEAVPKAVATADATLGAHQKRVLEVEEHHQQSLRMMQEIQRMTTEIAQVAHELATMAARRLRRDSGVGF